MPKLTGAAAERIADHFVHYLFEHYSRRMHVRRVASWVGLIVLAIERINGGTWHLRYTRQLQFEHGGKQFKVKFTHGPKRSGGLPRGRIDIVELVPGREGRIAFAITNLREAQEFYEQGARLLVQPSSTPIKRRTTEGTPA